MIHDWTRESEIDLNIALLNQGKSAGSTPTGWQALIRAFSAFLRNICNEERNPLFWGDLLKVIVDNFSNHLGINLILVVTEVLVS